MPAYRLGSLVPSLASDVWIAPSATVIGDVVLGEASSVWFGAVLRGDVCPIRIGARTNIQDNAVIHVTNRTAPTNVGSDVTIGHLALLHGCTVGDRCLVGMGSVVLDGAVLEDECLVGAGALVPPGMRVASQSLVLGRPARRVRTLTETELAQIRSAADQYVGYARNFAAELVPT
jgi:gamma-carbonic anhydrase